MNLRPGVLRDSSAMLALPDADDFHHKRAVAIAGQIASKKRPCSITNYIEAEAFAVLDMREIRRAFTFDRHFLQYRRIEVLGLSR